MLALAAERPSPAANPARDDARSWNLTSDAGLVAMAIEGDGRLGSMFLGPAFPSLRYPGGGHVEHLFQAGLWIGGRTAGGDDRVSTVTEDANDLIEQDELREFTWDGRAPDLRSDLQGSDLYHPDAVATWELLYGFDDLVSRPDHAPQLLHVDARLLAWDRPALDDGVVLEYAVTKLGGDPLSDVYVGLFADATVGNTEVTDPYDPGAPIPWNWYDDLAGAWRPGEMPEDPDGWLWYRHDDDGDAGQATSWVGCRFLSLAPAAAPAPGLPPVSYNQWRYRQVPPHDGQWLDDDGEWQPGKYQLLGNGHFDVGETPDIDFSAPGTWMSLLSSGPVPQLAAGDTLRVAFAFVCGADSVALAENAAAFARWHAQGYHAVGAPPAAAVASLAAPFPNPFNPGTILRYRLDSPEDVRLVIHALDGSVVRTLVASRQAAGPHAITWDGRDSGGRRAPSGRYVARLTAGTARLARGLTLVR
ncbi:MAG: FlgD immunoglobulin-like domain containing protein [Candidatus Krumholzibacteriia bacterium]